MHSTFQKFGVSKYTVSKYKLMYTFIHQGCIKLIISDSKDTYNVTKDLYFK